jgi:hypothetical protein
MLLLFFLNEERSRLKEIESKEIDIERKNAKERILISLNQL